MPTTVAATETPNVLGVVPVLSTRWSSFQHYLSYSSEHLYEVETTIIFTL